MSALYEDTRLEFLTRDDIAEIDDVEELEALIDERIIQANDITRQLEAAAELPQIGDMLDWERRARKARNLIMRTALHLKIRLRELNGAENRAPHVPADPKALATALVARITEVALLEKRVSAQSLQLEAYRKSWEDQNVAARQVFEKRFYEIARVSLPRHQFNAIATAANSSPVAEAAE